LRTLGWNYEDARGVMPIQRFFHRSRLAKFTVETLASLRAGLRSLRP
jgi:hypothetical protein